MNSLRIAAAVAALLVPIGCSLLCSTSGLQQPCDDAGQCLANFTCDTQTNLCLPMDAGGPEGCAVASQDTDCPAGACVNGFCSNALLAWSEGTNQPVDNACYPYYLEPNGTGSTYQLTGCVVTLPGDVLSSEPSIFDVTNGIAGGQALVSIASTCSGGYAFQFLKSNPVPIVDDGGIDAGFVDAEDAGVEIGKYVELDTYTDAGPLPTRTYPVYIPESQVVSTTGATRNVFSVSPTRLEKLLMAMNLSDGGLGLLDTGTLILGVVNDCSVATAGVQLSGVQVIVGHIGGPQVFYLDSNEGQPVPGRTATGVSGLYASYVPGDAGQLISITFQQQGSGGFDSNIGPDGGVVSIAVSGGGVLWVPISPVGP